MRRAEALKRLIARGQEDPSVLAVVLVGSVARRQTTPTSDLDVCLVLDPNLARGCHTNGWSTRQNLIWTSTSFSSFPSTCAGGSSKEGQVMLSKDDDALYELAFRTARAFEDFKHIYRNYLEVVRGHEGVELGQAFGKTVSIS
ncbi:MAG: nucleotidyltransferase domain-containing protein [Candidatus Methylomirabilia bacterium]